MLMFFSLNLNKSTDPLSLHASCPVIEGEKWSATKWIHERALYPEAGSSDCTDENPHWSTWAEQGECKKNPTYMIGSDDELGYCRKSCKVCSS